MRPSIVILAHPRSGSTTFRTIFESHELLSILNEPFNPTRRTGGWGYDYLNHLEQGGPLKNILNVISNHCCGAKHLLGQLEFEQDMEVFRHFQSRYLMIRRNLLRAVVSCKVADQTRQWHRRGQPQVTDAQLQPIPLQEIQAFLNTLQSNVARTREVIQRENLSCTEVYYEDLFDQTVGLPERIEMCVAYVRPHVQGIFSKRYPNVIARQLDHGSNKVNSVNTYRMIPNHNEIHQNLSCDETGHLFDW